MGKPTSFDLNEAIRRWRADFGSPSCLSAVELEELEAHLRDHVAALQAGGAAPEVAFHRAVKQLGDHQRMATEFAKINPQRIWLERAIWMVLGVFLLSVFNHLALAPSNVILLHALRLRWDPAFCAVLSRFGSLGGVVMMATLVWCVFAWKPRWGRALVKSCERSLLATGVAMALILWATSRMSFFYDYLLAEYLPGLHAWLFPTIQPPYPDAAVMNRIGAWCGAAENLIWAIALCVLAARVARAEVRRISSPTGDAPQAAARLRRLERLLWMVAGYVLVQFAVRELNGWFLLPVLWAQPLLGPSAVPQHLLGFARAVLHLALWATPFWACSFFASRHRRLGGWIWVAFQQHPFSASLGATLLLNASMILGLLFWWSGVQLVSPGSGFGPIFWEWESGSSMLMWRIAPAALLVLLLRWRMKLREA